MQRVSDGQSASDGEAVSGDDRLWRELTGAGLTMVIVFAAIAVIQILVVRLGFWVAFRQAAKNAV